MSNSQKVKRILSSSQKKIARSAASHVSATCEGFKVVWCDHKDNWHFRLFDSTYAHKAWGWYYAKCTVCPFVVIYERHGNDFQVLQGSGTLGTI